MGFEHYMINGFMSLLFLFSLLIFIFSIYLSCGKAKMLLLPIFGITLCLFGFVISLLNEELGLELIITIGLAISTISFIILIRGLPNRFIQDETTNLYNRAFLLHALKMEVETAQRYGMPLSVIYLSLSSIIERREEKKEYILLLISQIIKNCIRQSDVLTRYCIDSFVLVLPHSDLKSAENLLLRLEREVYKMWHMPGKIDGGIAQYWINGLNPEELINTARQRCYEKPNNKN